MFLCSAILAGQCSDSTDNDGDGLVDWHYDQGCTDADDPTEGGITTGSLDNGWTVFEPSNDTRIIFVSSSGGNDNNDGSTPEKAMKTIAVAFDSTRADHPDWILLKRGDTWYENMSLRNGRSRTEPFLVATYGESTVRPLLKTDSSAGFSVCCKDYHYMAVSGIHFYAHTRDFDSPEFASQSGSAGFNLYVGDTYTGTGVIIEDCVFRFYTNNVVQGLGSISDIVIRRNLILDDYSSTSHSQGMYTKNVSLLLEENIFDHNGWYMQQIDAGSDKDSGQATMFNHNTYYCNSHGVTFRGNMFLRPSSMGNKWTANDGEGSARDIIIDNNLYFDGEIGIGIGGNVTEPPYRFKNVIITNNVITDIGLSRPTNRTLGWCLDINDWDTGRVEGNLFIHQASTEVRNVYAINLDGETREVSIAGNIIHGLYTTNRLLTFSAGSTKVNITFSDNKIQCPGLDARLARVDSDISNYTFSRNTWFSARAPDEWFTAGGTSTDLSGWVAATGETGALAREITFPDPDRHIATYHTSIGKPASVDSFISEARKQSRLNWRGEYTAPVINDWIRQGFGLPVYNDIRGSDLDHDRVGQVMLEVWPNPFSTSMDIKLNSSAVLQIHSSTVNQEIKIFDINGRLVSNLANCGTVELQHCGTSYRWHAQDQPAGIYIVRVKLGDKTYSRNVCLVK
jgi:hypothetical protein